LFFFLLNHFFVDWKRRFSFLFVFKCLFNKFQTKFSEDGLKQVSLMVKDSADRSKTLLKDINVQQSVPEWEEIIPF